VAVLRRLTVLLGLIPVVGAFVEWVPIPYHFDYFMGDGRIGGLERILGLRDRYRLDVTGDAARRNDAVSCLPWRSLWTPCRRASRPAQGVSGRFTKGWKARQGSPLRPGHGGSPVGTLTPGTTGSSSLDGICW
jgi:hypothetical protein